MIRHSPQTDDGFTGLELVIITGVILGVAAILLVHFSGSGMPAWNRLLPGGLVAESTYISGDNLQPAGNVYGFPSVNHQLGTTPVIVVRQDPASLGVVRLVVSLFMGDTGAIDMDKVRIRWNTGSGPEYIQRIPSGTLVCPNWTISNKFNMLPGRTADADDLLEPDEQFELTLCPTAGIPPYGSVSFTISPEGVAMPLTITRSAPSRIQPVMNLG